MYFGKVSINFCVILSVNILMSGASFQQATAQSVPACRVIQPRQGQVCFTEHPFSARQRDEGGTRDHQFIVERVASNYVIVDYELVIDGEFGAVSRPTGSIVSATGNAAIIQESARQVERLGETKSKLKQKAQGCVPPVCGQLESQIDRIDREIENLSSTQRSAVSAGGNEKILFTYTTSVSCRKILGIQTCGSGAGINGRVRVNQRYLGDPDSLRQGSLSLIEQSNSLIQASEAAVNAQRTALASQLPPGTDLGYDSLPRAFVDVNGDGKKDFCRFVGDSPNIFIACMLGTSSGFDIEKQVTAFTSARGINQGYPNRPRGFRDVNGDGKSDYCRFDGPPGKIQEYCNPAFETGFGDDSQRILTGVFSPVQTD
jgi:hypothetical protein